MGYGGKKKSESEIQGQDRSWKKSFLLLSNDDDDDDDDDENFTLVFRLIMSGKRRRLLTTLNTRTLLDPSNCRHLYGCR